MRPRKMQPLCRFLLHRDTEGVTFHVTSEQRTEEQRHAQRDCDYKKNRNRGGKNQQFPSEGHQLLVTIVTKLPVTLVTVVTNHLACLSSRVAQTEKRKCRPTV